MSNYAVISDVSKAIVNLLRENMVPNVIKKPEMIGVCNPKEKESFQVGITLYDIKEDFNSGEGDLISLPDGRFQDPPVSYELFYAVSVFSKAKILERALDEQLVFGKLIQVMNDNKVLLPKYTSDTLKAANEKIFINMLKLDFEDKAKIWETFNEPYRLSMFFSVRPILVESAIIRDSKRRVSVVDMSSNYLEK